MSCTAGIASAERHSSAKPASDVDPSIRALAEAYGTVTLDEGTGIGELTSTQLSTLPTSTSSANAADWAVVVEDADFKWLTESSLPLLKNINLRIPHGSLTAVIGQVGCGKSSLFSAIWGEMHLCRGRVFLDGLAETAAYMTQESWIRNDSLQNNVLLGLPMDTVQYQAAIGAAALRQDLEMLPDGDLTEIGEKGINLSGGQKARVCLARCFYRVLTCETFFFDDPLSAVDVHVAEHIFQRGIVTLLQGKTRVLVMNSHLRLLQQCDTVIVMGPLAQASEGASADQLAEQAAAQHVMRRIMGISDDAGAVKAEALTASSSLSQLTMEPAPMQASIYTVLDSGPYSTIAALYPSLTSAERQAVRQEHDEIKRPDLHRARSFRAEQQLAQQLMKEATLATESDGSGGVPLSPRSMSTASDRQPVYSLLRLPSVGADGWRQWAAQHLPSWLRCYCRPGKLVKLSSQRSRSTVTRMSSGSLVDEEEAEAGSVPLKVYTEYFQAGAGFSGRAALLIILISFGVTQAARIGSDWWLSIWASRSLFPQADDSWWLWTLACWLFGAFALLLVRSVVFVSVTTRAALKLHDQMFRTVLAAPVNTFFDVTPVGRILNRFSRDQQEIDDIVADSLSLLIQLALHLLGALVLCAVVAYWFAAVIIPLGYIFWRVQQHYRFAARDIRRLSNIMKSPLYAGFNETFSGAVTIRAYGLKEAFTERFQRLLADMSRVYVADLAILRWLAVRLELIGASIVAAVAFLAVFLRNDVSVQSLALSLSYVLQFTAMLHYAVKMFVMVEASMTSAERLFEYGRIKGEAPAEIPARDPPPSWPEHGAIRLRRLCVRYRPYLPLVLNDISCEIKPREKIGICGRTGAGKSSLMLALFRIVEPDRLVEFHNEANAAMEIDGVDISKIGLTTLRSRMAIIPQDPVLFGGTLRYNMDPFLQHADDELWRALDRVSLGQTVRRLAGGLDYLVSEYGTNLSAGQRQLVCIARALLRNAKIVVLDEATAAVDAETDALIQTAIRELFADCTVLTIAHRLDTIVYSDRIMVLQDGRIAEFDAPLELMARADGIFADMVSKAGANAQAQLRSIAQDRAAGRAVTYSVGQHIEIV